ncbi:biopolymer transporter ExbD [Pusillimonas sp. NJUB218]|uniref:ExbD/TolR family protein n=1 Tax=Pusillimonas sp. NJUB218 TaxID=2023230 RepID=UPI000F4C9D72|nr:biopolymer transporter ExbD [Pusillimonas sp. NJUB218]ROT46288.1 biopolymer transporter ExbD [Pusillimonas sp. NJUB218]
MNFRQRLAHDEPEINLIPLIDILLVILIFLAATTSFQRFQQLNINLPQASAQAITAEPLVIAISQDGMVALGKDLLDGANIQNLVASLQNATAGQTEPLLLINADAQAPHQAVIRVMEAARLAGIRQVSFATQGP